MTLINRVFLLAASQMLKNLDRGRLHPMDLQHETFEFLIEGGLNTLFGKDHHFDEITTIADFQKRVPIRDYDAIQPYIDKLRNGEHYVLWREKIKFFARSSGTSSDRNKYIPISPTNLSGCHIGGMQRMLANYINLYPDSKLFSGKALTLGGSVAPDTDRSTFTGDLSAILLKNSPVLVETVRVPDRDVAMLKDFNQKIDLICKQCSHEDVTNFAGVPSWNLIMLKRVLEYNNVATIPEVWPNIELFMHGGISFDPYREQFDAIIPKGTIRYFENYNASEGYFAFQDDPEDKGMLLTLDNGVFYEFIPLRDLDKALSGDTSVKALCLDEVQVGEPYAIIITTTAGLWRFLIGDVVTFTSTYPHKIIITGRTQLFINAFGEELMISNAEKAMAMACQKHNATVSDYTVAPVFLGDSGRGYHQWVIEFDKEPSDIEQFTETLDSALCSCNSDYEAKRTHTITMDRLQINVVPSGTFYKWMLSRGKVGGQNKVPRLSGERKYVEQILEAASIS